VTDYLGQDIRKLGFGLMRLPSRDGEIDHEQVKQMADLFLESGFTYFDTAYGYNGGKSEEAFKICVVDRHPRESFTIATKLPAFGAKTAEEARAMFDTSLRRTGAGYFDFYLLHNLGGERTAKFDEYGIWDFLKQKKEEGLIRHLGFSMHDKAAHLDEVLTKHPEVEFVQLQINYADWDSPVIESRKCYETVLKHGKPVVIMEPVKGGLLADPPEAVKDILLEADPYATPASWAVRFAASLPGIVTVLSGMSNLDQMRDNLATMGSFSPLTGQERDVIAKAQEYLMANPGVPCTDCRYCTPGCPARISIPEVFKALNSYLVYNRLDAAKGDYHWATVRNGKASECISCGQCEGVCPQSIAIIAELGKAAGILE